MSTSETPVLQTVELPPSPAPWPTLDPFLFCVHHDDAYPNGDGALGPEGGLAGRAIGSDFASLDGWNMYHGSTVPGFPQHPHRGFETITYARQGLIDHADSLGATARFGTGDVQWMTAGSGIVHAEMFPLADAERPNPLELFQIWLNLPAADKMVDPYFTMLWNERLGRLTKTDDAGRTSEITVLAGALAPVDGSGTVTSPPPPPDSWASKDAAELTIWHVRLEPGASVELPAAASAAAVRTLYFFDTTSGHTDGATVTLGETSVAARTASVLEAGATLHLTAGVEGAELLLLGAVPIGEPVAQQGPFVMNTDAEIRQAFEDYRRTGFGGWPWPNPDPNHGATKPRFAQHADGRVEDPAEAVKA